MRNKIGQLVKYAQTVIPDIGLLQEEMGRYILRESPFPPASHRLPSRAASAALHGARSEDEVAALRTPPPRAPCGTSSTT